LAYCGVSIGSTRDPFKPQLPQTDASLLRLGRVLSEACKRKLGLFLGWHVLLIALGTLLGPKTVTVGTKRRSLKAVLRAF